MAAGACQILWMYGLFEHLISHHIVTYGYPLEPPNFLFYWILNL